MLSLVIPCYNEQEVLPALFERIATASASFGDAFEVVLVDDGSRDHTWQLIREMNARDERFRGVQLARNFGHQTAVSAGLAHASGDAVIVMDADLQDPPEELHRFIEKWREGYEVVYAIRTKRKEGALKRASYKIFYRILARMASIDIPLDSGDFCLMDRRVVDILNAMPERNRFIRGLRSWVGFRQIGVAYERDARAAGEVKYTFRKLVKLATDGIFSFSTAPLRLASYLGLIVSVVALAGVTFTVVQRIYADWFSAHGFPYVPGYYTMIATVLFLGGVQLLSLGIIGEFIGRIYDEVKGRPLWTIQETAGLPDRRAMDDTRNGSER